MERSFGVSGADSGDEEGEIDGVGIVVSMLGEEIGEWAGEEIGLVGLEEGVGLIGGNVSMFSILEVGGFVGEGLYGM